MFLLWFRLQSDHKKRLWRLYGSFTALGCVGSIIGAIASLAEIKYEENLHEVLLAQNTSESLAWSAEVSFWTSVLAVPESLHILFISVTLLMVLDRMVHVDFATSRGLTPHLIKTERVVTFIVVILNATSVCFSAVNASAAHRSVPLFRSAAIAVAVNDTKSSKETLDKLQSIDINKIVPHCCESASLLFMVASFIVVLRVCTRRIQQINQRAIADSSSRLAIQDDSSASESVVAGDVRVSVNTFGLLSNMKGVHLQIFVTVVFVFLALLVMAVVKLLDGISDALMNDCEAGNPLDCHPCRNSFGLLQNWFRSTPELFALGVSVPQPLALLVALWAMTSKLMMQMIKSNGQEHAVCDNTMQQM